MLSVVDCHRSLHELRLAYFFLACLTFVWMQDEFFLMMRNLPEDVSDDIIEEMFRFADKDEDGKINFEEFCEVVGNTDVHKKMVVDV